MKAKSRGYEILYFVGLISTFLVFTTAFSLGNVLMLVLFAMLPILYCSIMKTKYAKRISLVLVLVGIALLVINLKDTQQAIYACYNQITTVYATSSSYSFLPYTVTLDEQFISFAITKLFLSIYIFEMIILYYFMMIKKSFFVSFAVTFLIFFPTMLYSTHQPWYITIFLFIYWAMLFLTSKLKKQAIDFINLRSLAIYVSCCFLAFLLAIMFIIPESSYLMKASGQATREKLLRVIDDFAYNVLYGKEEIGEVDLGRAGNRLYTNATQLIVSADKATQLYLKTFSGDIYKDNHWSLFPKETYQSDNRIAWNEIRTWMNQTNIIETEQKSEMKMSIKDQRVDTRYALVPYYMKSLTENLSIYYDSYATFENKTADNVEYKLWNKTENQKIPTGEAYDAYVAYVQKNYLQIPEGMDEFFVKDLEMVAKEDFSSTNVNVLYAESSATHETEENKLVTYIQNTLSEHAIYTLSPGKSPKDKDFIQYFLGENKKGYCVHFASAATMMFRYYGIPARYVEGYRVDPSDFAKNLQAKIPDKSAHAWVEVFNEAYGWIPVETTPTFKSDAPNDKFVAETTNRPNTTPPTTNNQQPNTVEGGKQTLVKDVGTTTDTATSIPWKIVLPITLPFICLLGIYIQRKLRFSRRHKKMSEHDHRLAVRALYTYLDEFQQYGAIISEEVYFIGEKARFSNHSINEEEYQRAYSLVQEEVQRVLSSLSTIKKLKLYYWNALH